MHLLLFHLAWMFYIEKNVLKPVFSRCMFLFLNLSNEQIYIVNGTTNVIKLLYI